MKQLATRSSSTSAQTGEYIVNRLLPKMVRAACAARSISVEASEDDWVLKLTKDTRTQWIFGYKFDLNNAAAAAIAQDKVATFQALDAAGITAVPHVLARTMTGMTDTSYMQNLESRKIVVKPLNGTGGRGVALYDSLPQAITALQLSSDPNWTFSPFIEIQSEYRVIILDEKVMLAYKKLNPYVHNGLRYFNLGLGAVAEHININELDAALRNMALQAAQTISLRLAAVDIILKSDGNYAVIEINDGITMEHYALQGEDYKNRAADLYDAIIDRMFLDR